MKRLTKLFKKYFIPHEHNEFKPHFLRHETILLVGLLVILVELAFLVQVFIVFDKTKFLAAVLPGILTDLTNKERAEAGLPPLVENSKLVQAAELKASDMAQKGYFAHTSPEGLNPWHWLSEVGYTYRYAGENLAVNFFESSDVSRAWMNSPSHKANIIKPVYTEIGIAVASGTYEGRHTVFVAQFFGTPIASASTFTPTAELTPAPIPTPTPAPVVTTVTPTPTPRTTTPVTPKPEVVEEELREIAEITPTETIILGEEVFTAPNEQPRNQNNFAREIQRILSSPLHVSSYFYAGLAVLVMFTLLMVLFIRSELSHPKMIAKGFALLGVIILLLLANLEVFSTRTIVPDSGISANAINAIEFAP